LLEFADRLAVPPTHIGLLLVAPVEDGIGLTDTVVDPDSVTDEQAVVEILRRL
jgi:hypothetical protein